ncbi:hypothetical protein MNEG_13366 [Monoraphidium neglectum]|uniref:Uncharacterized protein n=1 Tax=Monoraphidium neglectum TaxID=145388 RepID=A0A0D2MHV1_9CHLO|nr:hypothetical protein MNEG_13366 [Monoraphidium neglectum]KIY94595.1 hypothetical protein MNEG_13366 [Monoraphidium neglectum]|eukprot:XP_013893615.1 hypothetical protein MNEG_13366 [Monoraphidium neglectum]
MLLAQPLLDLVVLLASKLGKLPRVEAVGVLAAAVAAIYGLVQAIHSAAGFKAGVAGVAGAMADIEAKLDACTKKVDEARAFTERLDRLERRLDAAIASALARRGAGAAAAPGGGGM